MRVAGGVLALALAACSPGARVDVAALEARHPGLRAGGAGVLASARPYALPLAGTLTLFLCRWPSGSDLRVGLEGETSEAARAELAAALRTWERAGLGLRFTAVGAGEAAAIRVRVRSDWITSQADTVADCAVDGDSGASATRLAGAHLVSASIHVARDDPHLRLTLLHELGHALGFQGHAAQGRTLMRSREADVLARARELPDEGAFDDAALRPLYALPSGEVVGRIALDRAQTALADRLAALAPGRGLVGPLLRVGDREALVWWLDPPGGRLALRLEGLSDARRRPAALRLVPASRASAALLRSLGIAVDDGG